MGDRTVPVHWLLPSGGVILKRWVCAGAKMEGGFIWDGPMSFEFWDDERLFGGCGEVGNVDGDTGERLTTFGEGTRSPEKADGGDGVRDAEEFRGCWESLEERG